MRIPCPHCGTPGNIRTSRPISESSKEAYVQCPNIQCCHTWKVIVSAVATICPSLNPNPKVYLRPSSAKPRTDCTQGELGLNSS